MPGGKKARKRGVRHCLAPLFWSAFYDACHHAFDDLFAEDKVKSNDRRHGDQHCSHLFGIIRGKLSFEPGQGKGYGLQGDILDEDQGEGELVPVSDEGTFL